METRTDILNVIYLGTYFLHIQTVMVRSFKIYGMESDINFFD